MKQVVEELRTGKVRVAETPAPRCSADQLLIQTAHSLISVGTERMMIEMGQKSLIGKARARPDLVRIAYAKAKKEGFLRVLREALSRLDTPMPLGYSAAGTVLEVGGDVKGFSVGDRVAGTGAGFANHAEILAVPAESCVPLPPNVGTDEAAFVMLGGIALHGIRSAELRFGESVVVLGLGLIGLITAQIVRAYGCRVIGFDPDPSRVKLAREHGCPSAFVLGKGDPENIVLNLTDGIGADAVLLVAATKDNSPVLLAERVARKRGRIVLVGVNDISLTRKMFWDKELSFTVSRASGPSRESHGTGLLPPDLVRWTDPRNHAEFIRLMAGGAVSVNRLITHRIPIAEAESAYAMILAGRERFIGVLLEYPEKGGRETSKQRKTRINETTAAPADRKGVGFIGAGLFTRNFLAPAVRKSRDVRLVGVAANTGLSAEHLARKHGFSYATTDAGELLKDPGIGSVIVSTRHDLHERFVVESLRAGKHVFVEKPLCVDEAGLTAIVGAKERAPGQIVMVGFNRRYSPLAVKMRSAMAERTGPMQVLYRVNAGFIPPESWVHDPKTGAGRIIGEVCHFIDLIQFFTGALPEEVFADSIKEGGKYRRDDNVNLSLRMSDGSLGTVLYCSMGSKTFSRERVEAYWDECVGVIEDFRTLELVTPAGRSGKRMSNQAMGYPEEIDAFFKLDPAATQPLFREAVATTAATLAAVESLRSHRPVPVRIGGDVR